LNVQAMLANILLVRQGLEGHHPTRPPPDEGPSAPVPQPPSGPPAPWLWAPPGPTLQFAHLLPLPTNAASWRHSGGLFCALRSYLGRLHWPATTPDPRPRPITFVELALDFELTTGFLLPPLYRGRTAGTPATRPPPQQPASLYHRSYTFAAMWRSLERLTTTASLPWPHAEPTRSFALGALGLPASQGLDSRPALVHPSAVGAALRQIPPVPPRPQRPRSWARSSSSATLQLAAAAEPPPKRHKPSPAAPRPRKPRSAPADGWLGACPAPPAAWRPAASAWERMSQLCPAHSAPLCSSCVRNRGPRLPWCCLHHHSSLPSKPQQLHEPEGLSPTVYGLPLDPQPLSLPPAPSAPHLSRRRGRDLTTPATPPRAPKRPRAGTGSGRTAALATRAKRPREREALPLSPRPREAPTASPQPPRARRPRHGRGNPEAYELATSHALLKL
jgi:hypothetical protein